MIETVFSLFALAKAMVSSHAAMKARTACGFSAMTLSVAKMICMWKSLTRSPKVNNSRSSPRRSFSKVVDMSVVTASISPTFSSARDAAMLELMT